MLRRFALSALLLTLLCVLIPSATQSQGGDQLVNSFQNCTGIPCMTVKNAAATGPWTGSKNINDLLTYSFQSCSGIPCMTVTGVTGGGGGSTAFQDLTGGTNTTAGMVVGSGATLGATGTGQINATSVPGTGITSPVLDAMIPNLNALSTGLANSKCVETNASGLLVVAANACNVATVGTISFTNITSGGNVSATMVVGAGGSLTASGGQISATDMPGTGLTTPVPDGMIPDLNLLTTGLTPLNCVETDAVGHFVSTGTPCGAGGGGGGGSFAGLTSGTNNSANMIVGAGASLSASGGDIIATSMPGEALSSPVPDSLIPNLNALSTGLTPIRCVETDATGKLVSASAVCSSGGAGTSTWGTIGGTLSNQFDLQGALDSKVPLTRTVNGHALTSDIAVTAADVGLGNVSNLTDAQRNSQTAELTNKQVVPRVNLLTVITGTPNHVTPNADNTDVAYNYTFTTAMQIDTPTFTTTPNDQQLLAIEFATATPQALTWATGYSNECGLQLPTSTTGIVASQQVYNRFLYRYSTTSTKWCLIASTKADAVRVTTLAPNNAYNCPADNSDQCEMDSNLAAGTITVGNPGVGANGQRLSMAFKCSSLMTINWTTAGVFLDSPNYTLPTSCPLDTTKWLSADLRYSTVLSKWQLTRGVPAGAGSLPGTVVQTNQANTYTAGSQDFGGATSMVLPKAASPNPTAAGAIIYDTDQEIVQIGENGILTGGLQRTLSVTDGGNTNASITNSTNDFDHTGTTYTIPANYFLQHRALRVCVAIRFTTSAGSPTMQFKLKLAGFTAFSNTAGSTIAGKVNFAYMTCFVLYAQNPVGGSVNILVVPQSNMDGICCGDPINIINQPVAGRATNAAIPIVFTTKWGAALSGNTITTDLMIVEALN